jgi:hypothetical protein
LPLVATAAVISLLPGGTAQTRVHSLPIAHTTTDRRGHSDDHMAELAELAASRASHIATRSGDWSDSRTWSSGVPAAGARVVIPEHVIVTVTAPIAVPALDWVRVEGTLHFSPAGSSQLSVTTVLVTRAGALSVGAPDRPLDPSKTVQFLFAPRRASPQITMRDMAWIAAISTGSSKARNASTPAGVF